MKLLNSLVSTILILCLVGAAYAAVSDPGNWDSDGGKKVNATVNQSVKNTSSPGNVSGPRDWGSDGGKKKPPISGQSAHKVSPSASKAAQSKVMKVTKTVETEVPFTSISTSGNCLDNTKRVAVYMPDMTNPMTFGATLTDGTVRVAYDPLSPAMFYEYDPAYIGDSAASLETLTPANYDLLIVPMQQMSNDAATAINTYVSNGGSVWFLNDPCLTPTGETNPNRIAILDSGVSTVVSGSTTISVVNTDDMTQDLPESFKPIGTASKTNEFRLMSGAGTISGMDYQVLMSIGSNAVLIKFENPDTGARVIYSNPNMFVSGGTSSYFDAQTATKLFLQTKAWVMKLAMNPSGVAITYPKSDKQFIVTIDDVEAASWEGTTRLDPMFNAERAQGVNPSDVNTFFILPSIYTLKSGMQFYAQNGDPHTLHPHADINSYEDYLWSVEGTSVATYKATINADQSLINNLMGTNNYGFSSWRFPGTTFCTNSMQAVANSGFTIESSSGPGTMGIQIGNSQDNTLLFPKQMLINNKKTGLTEMEIPAWFDIDFTTGTDFYNKYNENTPQFKYGNFPMNFVVGCHVIGAGSNPELANGLGQIIAAEKAAKPSYATFDTLAKYINGVKSATITASVSGDKTTVNVVNTKPITDFTIKILASQVKSATCDGASVSLTQDSLTGNSYITKSINPGTHTFVIYGTSAPVLPVANFTANPTSGTYPLNVQFTDKSTNAESWAWDFGDGGISNLQNPSHQYTTQGTFTVKLTVSNAQGTSSKSAQIVVSKPISTAPVAKFTMSPTTGVAPLNVNFNDASTGSPTKWAWDFGDGGTSELQNGSHKYVSAGTYTVKLTVSNTAGSNSTSKKLTVSALKPPVASFTANPTSGSRPLTVNFKDTSTGTVTSRKWNFGDGSTSTSPTISHKYRYKGTYTAKLTVKNSAGSSYATKKIRVR